MILNRSTGRLLNDNIKNPVKSSLTHVIQVRVYAFGHSRTSLLFLPGSKSYLCKICLLLALPFVVWLVHDPCLRCP